LLPVARRDSPLENQSGDMSDIFLLTGAQMARLVS
jgi:hypothetical protein